MADDSKTWEMIHAERSALVDLLETLTPQQWAAASSCGTWTVRIAAAHVLAGAEQTPSRFLMRMTANGFRFNTMIDRDARQLGEQAPAEIIARLRARTTTTNHPPAPIRAMLGEVVVHGADIRAPLAVPHGSSAAAMIACLEMYKTATFPVGGRKRIRGLRLIATDVDWSFGTGPEISGPASSLLLAMTGRKAGLEALSGDGVQAMCARVSDKPE